MRYSVQSYQAGAYPARPPLYGENNEARTYRTNQTASDPSALVSVFVCVGLTGLIALVCVGLRYWRRLARQAKPRSRHKRKRRRRRGSRSSPPLRPDWDLEGQSSGDESTYQIVGYY
eukprot:Blabericola_migrator_1__6727@NODE_33_length_18162_cov_161_418900_g29_i0_p15_GENE_NODE_33_length_18162_cov_161_418900_g29_i0NODE_33_length_18162_cov_161_418900_g29_i0_p15_ORF_typecomplete_len117_score18_61Trp_oprn_chp/PF09534_10/0_0017DUF5305/PF17231_2/0_0022TMEM51/PF15345_6/0_022DUF1180/PF06679_12/0_022Herpes_gE/PF02480_16/0_0237tm_1/PF00001_21/0_029Mid2/PF04478_12/0_043TMEM154/PF15102_6/0_061HemY_N/PF07219_13/0_075AXIN1_TNKS_BD/PF16646_5/0_92AXIN1_TNKS_BD/PF16646_5/4e02FAM176/PF14851_6/0_096Crg